MSVLACCAAPGAARRRLISRARCWPSSAIPDRKPRLAATLPHVDRRLVEIARALGTAPAVLLLDEPAAGLNEADTVRLGGLLQRLARAGLAVVLVEHDMALVMSISDEIIVLDAGRRIAAGPARGRAQRSRRQGGLSRRHDAGGIGRGAAGRRAFARSRRALRRLWTACGA